MLVLIRFFFGVLLHRRSPDELPESRLLLWSLVLLSAFVNYALLLVRQSSALSFAIVGATTVLDVAFVWCLLHAFGLDRRFVQTMSTLAGTSVLLLVFLAPVVLWGNSVDPNQLDAVAPTALQLLHAVWAIDVAGFVVARGIGRPYAFGVVIMLGYALLQTSLVASLIPVIG